MGDVEDRGAFPRSAPRVHHGTADPPTRRNEDTMNGEGGLGATDSLPHVALPGHGRAGPRSRCTKPARRNRERAGCTGAAGPPVMLSRVRSPIRIVISRSGGDVLSGSTRIRDFALESGVAADRTKSRPGEPGRTRQSEAVSFGHSTLARSGAGPQQDFAPSR